MSEPKKRGSSWLVWVVVAFAPPVLYIGSFGPACWLTARRHGDQPSQAMIVYYPVAYVLMRTNHRSRLANSLKWWMRVGLSKGFEAKIPFPTGGGYGARAIDPPPATWHPN